MCIQWTRDAQVGNKGYSSCTVGYSGRDCEPARGSVAVSCLDDIKSLNKHGVMTPNFAHKTAYQDGQLIIHETNTGACGQMTGYLNESDYDMGYVSSIRSSQKRRALHKSETCYGSMLPRILPCWAAGDLEVRNVVVVVAAEVSVGVRTLASRRSDQPA